MLIDRPRGNFLLAPILESVLLLVAAPWLLFPSVAPSLTVIALVITALIWLWPIVTRRKPLPYTPLNGAFLFFTIAIVAGIIASSDTDVTLSKTTGIVLGLSAWRLVIVVSQDKRAFRLVVMAYLLLGIGLIIIGLVSANWVVKLPVLSPILDLMPSRLLALPEMPINWVHANQLAGVLAFFLPLFLSLSLLYSIKDVNIWLKRLLFVVVIMLAVLLLITQSRAGWIGGLVGILAVLLFWYLVIPPSRKRTSLLAVLIVIAVVVALTAIVITSTSVKNYWNMPGELTFYGAVGTVNWRFEMWKWAVRAVEDFPLTGIGLGSFRYAVERIYPYDVGPINDIGHAHNIFLQIALDVGILGLVAYFSILLICFRTAWRVAKASPDFRPLAVGLLAALLALHVYGIVDALALGSKPAVIFWIALGLVVAMERLSDTGKRETDVRSLTGQHSVDESYVS